MIKWSHSVSFLPSFHKSYFWTYSKLLSSGYIIVIPFQSNDIFDPNNYRGITFTNAIEKHFDKIMDIQLDFFLGGGSITLLITVRLELIEKLERQAMCIFFRHLLIIIVVLRMVECMPFFYFQSFKTFDTVVCTEILFKFLRIGVRTKIINLSKV